MTRVRSQKFPNFNRTTALYFRGYSRPKWQLNLNVQPKIPILKACIEEFPLGKLFDPFTATQRSMILPIACSEFDILQKKSPELPKFL